MKVAILLARAFGPLFFGLAGLILAAIGRQGR